MANVSFDPRAITIDGQRTLLLSGAVHYPRSTPAMWPQILRRSKDAGLNTIETYVFWNLHERERGVLDFSGRLDLMRFCQEAKDLGLHVILRIGPYICAETNYGGFPAWLRDVPGMAMRTYNEPFMREKERWVRLLVEYMRPMFAPHGGPIIMAQIENEYDNVAAVHGDAGGRYLQWSMDLSLSLGLDIPWIMCLGGGGTQPGAAQGAIETINGFYAHTKLDAHWKRHANQPGIWTENWPSWYDVWGQPHHRRSPQDVAYGVARFFAQGGTGVNYYMWHGGTNLGRDGMYMQTTSYDFDAPLDEYGQPTTKSNHLASLHRVLHDHADVLLSDGRPKPQALGEKQAAYVYGKGAETLAFLCNDDQTQAAQVEFNGTSRTLPAWSVTMLRDEKVVFDTSRIAKKAVVQRTVKPIKVLSSEWERWEEPWPGDRADLLVNAVTTRRPIEQLLVTRDRSDYCWYMTTLPTVSAGARATLQFDGVADFVYVFVDGELVAMTPAVPVEDRGSFDGKHWKQTFALTLPDRPGPGHLAVLCCSLGLIKGEWMIGGQNMVKERKGIFASVKWNGKALPGPWTTLPGLAGEWSNIAGAAGGLMPWKRASQAAMRTPLQWWRTTFRRPAGDAPLCLDLAGMGKGMLFINGRCAGRYWLAEAADAPVVNWHRPAITHHGAAQPTQRYYHLPPDWLRPVNTLVVLEELAGDPTSIRLCQRR